MARKDYVINDLAGYSFNGKYPPDYKLNGGLYHGYKNGKEETLFYDFAVLGYDLKFVYKGESYYFLSEENYVARCNDHFTEEFERYSDGNAALEQFCIDGKSLIHLIDELEEVEAV